MKKIIQWIKESNHYKHIICVGVVAIIAYIMQLLNCPIEIIVGGVAAVSLEYKDYAHGGKFDWQDIIASMIGAIIVLIIRFSSMSIIFIF